MLVHRLRRWPNIETTMAQCLVFAGYEAITMWNKGSVNSKLQHCVNQRCYGQFLNAHRTADSL